MRPIRFFFLFILVALIAGCRSAEVEGVYGGIVTNAGMLSGTHGGREMVLFLRSDGTFTDNMRERDWKSNVKGKYVVTGSTLKLVYHEQKKVDEFRINSKGHLLRTGTVLLKMDKSDSVPAGIYSFKDAQPTGGPATGQPYLGGNRRSTYYFDGSGQFRDSGTDSRNAAGTYQLQNGELTLHFTSGGSEKHSFFARREAGTNKLAAVINGRFYFTGDLPGNGQRDSSSTDEETKGTPSRDGENFPVPADESSNSQRILPLIQDVVDSLRARHGGSAIDNIKTIYTKASSEGFEILSYIDFGRSRVRFELYQDDNMVAVEQLEGNKGWRWMQGKITSLEPVRIDEIIFSQHMGITGFRKDLSPDLLDGILEQATHGFNLSFQVDGRQFIYVLDSNLNLLGDAYRIGDIEQASQYSNFKLVDGVFVPFTIEIFRDGQKSTLKVDKYVVNQPLKTKWLKPPVEKADDKKQ
ncbi:MAG: hypothetical protein EOP49_11945 [Sphingobacteriales bacterium]|nr:MAG: hypothetical protein EOP49_11945 [Sphingobacteriales bacterium]